jgi:hypothetical protein
MAQPVKMVIEKLYEDGETEVEVTSLMQLLNIVKYHDGAVISQRTVLEKSYGFPDADWTITYGYSRIE